MHNRQLRASWSSDFKVQVWFLIGFRVRAGGELGSGAKFISLLAFGSLGPLAHRPCSGSIAIGPVAAGNEMWDSGLGCRLVLEPLNPRKYVDI